MNRLARLSRPIGQRGMKGLRYTSDKAGEKIVSPHIGFYKTFARPIAKVLLMATFTYQLAYFGWVKLEKDELKREKNAELEGLERKLSDLTGGKFGVGKA